MPSTESPTSHTADPNLEELRKAGVDDWLIEAVARQSRGEPRLLENLLDAIGTPIELDTTRARCRCHLLGRNANGDLRVDALVGRLADQVTDYCLPRSRVAEAQRYLERTGSAAMFSALDREARELFNRASRSGEAGELLLYLLLENVLRLPQLLCKMPLKTSTEMHVHGVDGVHGKLLDDGKLALYWGEAKLYAEVSQAIDACFESIAPYLSGGSHGPAKRDLLLVREHLDLGDLEINEALARYFDDRHPEAARVEFRGACLIGFDLDEYPDASQAEELTGEIADAIAGWNKRVGERVAHHRLDAFELEVFCVPLPSVQAFRDKLREKLGR